MDKRKCPINDWFYISNICAKHCDDYPKGHCPVQVIEQIIKERQVNGKEDTK